MTHLTKQALPTRRALLTTAAAAPIAGTALAAAPEAEDPVLPLYREFVQARREWYSYIDIPGSENWDKPEVKALEERENAAFLALIETTPTSMAGIAALISVLWDNDGPAVTPEHEEYLKMADYPPCKLMRAIWRAASGQTGLPPSGRMEGVGT